MNGVVDRSGRALVRIRVRNAANSAFTELDAWVDTGFTGELVLPQPGIAALGLSEASSIRAELGDGTRAVLSTFACVLEWFGENREIEAVATVGAFPLVGVGLLQQHKLSIDYQSRVLTIE